jgi:hypothetical protein
MASDEKRDEEFTAAIEAYLATLVSQGYTLEQAKRKASEKLKQVRKETNSTAAQFLRHCQGRTARQTMKSHCAASPPVHARRFSCHGGKERALSDPPSLGRALGLGGGAYSTRRQSDR